MKILPLFQIELCSAYEETHENAKAFDSDGNEIRLTATVGDGHWEAVVGCLLVRNRPIDFSRSRKIKRLLVVVNAGKAAVVESKCSPRTGSSPHCAPKNRTLHWSDGNEEVSIPPWATVHCNCRRPSANQWWKRRRDAEETGA